MKTVDSANIQLEKSINDIFIEQLKLGNSIRVNIRGESMFPSVKKDDVVIVRPVRFEETRIGDIIAFKRNSTDSILTLHRIIKKRNESIVTKGDANRHGDFPVYFEDIYGKVAKIERKGKTVNLETGLHRLLSPLIAWFSWGLAAIKEVLVHPGLVIRKIFKNS